MGASRVPAGCQRWLLALLAAVLLLVAGCGGVTPWHGDPAFSSDERAAIDSAAAELAERTGEAIVVLWDGGEGRRILRSPPPVEGKVGYYRVPRGASADEAELYLQPGLPLDELRAVALHEFAHSVGLDHHEGEGVLNGTTLAYQWTAADQAYCTAAGVCP